MKTIIAKNNTGKYQPLSKYQLCLQYCSYKVNKHTQKQFLIIKIEAKQFSILVHFTEIIVLLTIIEVIKFCCVWRSALWPDILLRVSEKGKISKQDDKSSKQAYQRDPSVKLNTKENISLQNESGL